MYNSISKICPKFQFLNSQSQVFWGQWPAAARWECGKHFEKREYFISNLCCMRWYVLNKSLLSTILAYLVWLNFVPPILEHFCPLFVQIAETHSFCPDGVSFCPDYHYQPLFFTQQPQTPFRDMYVHKKTPQPHPKTPLFLAWTWKWAKWTTVWAIWTPTGQNVWKVAKKLIHEFSCPVSTS